MVPLKPPPPNMTALVFHTVGSASLNRMSGAAGSTGEILPLTRQCSGTVAAPVPLAATTVAEVTAAPEVGRPIESAGMVIPTNCAQVSGLLGGRRWPSSVPSPGDAVAVSVLPPPQPARNATKKTAKPPRIAAFEIPMLSPVPVVRKWRACATREGLRQRRLERAALAAESPIALRRLQCGSLTLAT